MSRDLLHIKYIYNARGLALLSESIRMGRRFEGACICLTRDIDLSDYAACEGWKPVGNEKTSFAGIFDGCGYTITGLRIYRPAEDYQGLFGSVSGIVQNIRLRDFIVVGRDFTGSVAGCINSGSLSDTSAIGEVHGCNIVGGIVGSSVNSVLERNKFQGRISGKNYIGGISGVGWRSNITGCLNMSSFVKGRDCVGGITGSFFGENLEDCRCTGCINGRNSVGGMSGRLEDSNVLSCTAACSVNGNAMVGATGGFACGNNLIEGCVFACSTSDGSKHKVNLTDQVFTYEPDLDGKPAIQTEREVFES